MQRICPYLQYIHDAATAGSPLCLHPSDASSPPVFSKMPGCLENSSLPCPPQGQLAVMCASSTPFITSFSSEWCWKVTGPRLWRRRSRLSLRWSGCLEMRRGSGEREVSSARARGGRPRQGSDPGVPGGWWSPWWYGRLCSWSCCCYPVWGSGWNGQTN